MSLDLNGRQQYAIGGGVAVVALLALALSLQQPMGGNAVHTTVAPPTNGSVDEISWREMPLMDVRTGNTFRLDQFEKPVLLETFAVWCPTCLRQQKEVQELHERFDRFVSVSLDVDPNEDAQKVQRYIARHGFEWRYAVAPPAMTEQLVNRFGPGITVPPQAPMVLLCPDGDVRRLPNGVKSADTLQQQIEQGC